MKKILILAVFITISLIANSQHRFYEPVLIYSRLYVEDSARITYLVVDTMIFMNGGTKYLFVRDENGFRFDNPTTFRIDNIGGIANGLHGFQQIQFTPMTSYPTTKSEAELFYMDTDSSFYYWTGHQWLKVGSGVGGGTITGTIASGQIAVGTGVDEIGGYTNFVYDPDVTYFFKVTSNGDIASIESRLFDLYNSAFTQIKSYGETGAKMATMTVTAWDNHSSVSSDANFIENVGDSFVYRVLTDVKLRMNNNGVFMPHLTKGNDTLDLYLINGKIDTCKTTTTPPASWALTKWLRPLIVQFFDRKNGELRWRWMSDSGTIINKYALGGNSIDRDKQFVVQIESLYRYVWRQQLMIYLLFVMLFIIIIKKK